MKQLVLFHGRHALPGPQTQTAAILKAIIESDKGVKERDFRFNGFRARISELRRDWGVDLLYTEERFISQFGNPGVMRRHYLKAGSVDAAIGIYQRLNNLKDG